MPYYDDDDMLMLSGIQHYVFCPRQWALIHIDQQWQDNGLTTAGTIMHQRVDDPFERMMLNGKCCLRAVPIASHQLGLYGITDAVELYPANGSDNAIQQPGLSGYWYPYPVEYKHGKPKVDDCDILQLVAQVMCMEEMYQIVIPEAALFYGSTRRRETVTIADNLRQQTMTTAEAMHNLFAATHLPAANKGKACRSCSLANICQPDIHTNVAKYLKEHLYEENA